MRNILLIIANNLKVTFRKKGNIIIYIFLPLLGVLLSLLIYGGSDTSVLRVGVVNHDNGAFSVDLKDVIMEREGFAVFDLNENDINSKLLDFDLEAAIIIPEGFSDSVYNGTTRDVEIISLKGQATTAWIEQMLNSHIDSLFKLSAASGGDRQLFDKMYEQFKGDKININVIKLEDKKVGKYMTLTSIGFLIMFMMLGTSFTSMIILKEKRDRTYHRICSAPVHAKQYILANSITSLLILILQILFILFALKFVFHINTGVSGIALFIILLMFGFVAIGIGLLVTAFSNSSYMAGNLSTLIMTPTCMLGGCFWSPSLMPEFMQKISYFMPQRWAISAVEKLQANADVTGIYLNLLVLAAFALTLILVSIYKFSRTNNLQRFV